MSTTTDLSKFGNIELEEVENLLRAKRTQGLPDDFLDDGVIPMFNMSSGYVFLTNSDYQVAMMNGDKLESFYSCPECGEEGFEEDVRGHSDDSGCKDWEANTFDQEVAS